MDQTGARAEPEGPFVWSPTLARAFDGCGGGGGLITGLFGGGADLPADQQGVGHRRGDRIQCSGAGHWYRPVERRGRPDGQGHARERRQLRGIVLSVDGAVRATSGTRGHGWRLPSRSRTPVEGISLTVGTSAKRTKRAGALARARPGVALICAHVLRVFDRSGAVRCRDSTIRELVANARENAREQGGDPTMEVLRKRMGSNVIFFELIDQPPGPEEAEVFTFVVDIGVSVPAA